MASCRQTQKHNQEKKEKRLMNTNRTVNKEEKTNSKNFCVSHVLRGEVFFPPHSPCAHFPFLFFSLFLYFPLPIFLFIYFFLFKFFLEKKVNQQPPRRGVQRPARAGVWV
jgi:hypothetical protein